MEGEGKMDIHLVSSTESPELSHLKWAVTHSSIVGLDCEWKPILRSNQTTNTTTTPPVLLLQIACQLNNTNNNNNNNNNNSNSEVFLVDLSVVALLGSIHDLLTHLFLSPHILKLGFRFKQDLLYLSSTFTSHGHEPPSHKVEPFIDIASLYNNNHLLNHHTNNNTKSLSFICHQLLGISLSKELQCSDWSVRPLTQDQINYAALDALSLIHIFNLFRNTILTQGAIPSLAQLDTTSPLNSNLGLNQILTEPPYYRLIFSSTLCQAADLVKATIIRYPQSLLLHPAAHLEPSFTKSSAWDTMPMDYTLLQIVRQYGDKLILTESDGKPKTSRKRGKRKSSTGLTCKDKRVDAVDEWQGPPPWDLLLGGDGCPKFLCDVMVEGLAKHLRCVGIDAAIPYSRKPETRELIDQAIKEKRVVLTRDAKLLRHEYLLTNQIYRVKSLLKNDQLIEVIETFQLKISEDQLMSRCTKCNGRFIQKPLSIEEALEAAKGFQVIPNCLFDRNIEFWQCTDCNQLYWEGTQYHNAVQKFIDVCKITSTE